MSTRTRRALVKAALGIGLALALALTLTMGRVLADSPHFNSAGASINSAGNLVVSFKESGLGNNALINFTASANAVADYGCINGGGNHPKASNKQTVQGPVSASGQFSSGKNGSISQSLTITPPPLPTTFSCPNGQTLVLADVTYTNVAITDTTTPVSQSISGTFTAVFFTFK
ncbi:MAG TPA: hypothetical protein VF808_10640 [Ktedonobacterales bacterium]